MSYFQFPAVNKLKIIDASGEHIGAFQVADDQDLEHLTIGVYIQGTVAPGCRARISLYGAERYDSPLAVSDWADLEESSWIGNIRFDFNGFPLDSSNTYQMRVETQNYTRNGSTHFISCVCDYGSSVSNRVSANNIAVYMTIAGRR